MDSLRLSLVSELKKDLPAQQYDTWIKPLRAERHGNRLRVVAPNHHVLRWIRANLLAKLESRAEREAGGGLQVDLVLDDKPLADAEIVVREPIPVVPEKPSREEHRRPQGYEAFFVSVGTQRGRDLAIEGAGLVGGVKAIDYLLNINRGFRMNLGRKVLVVGGGFVAFDAARTALRGGPDEGSDIHAAVDAARSALRAGADEVHIASLESFSEMPVLRTAQGYEEFEQAKREGVVFHPQRGPRRFIGESGRLAAVEFVGVHRTYDDDGKYDPQYDPSDSEVFAADSVVLAIGQQTDLSFLRPADGVALTAGNLVRVDRETLATSSPGVYAGGDVAFGPRNIIDAVANGKRAARGGSAPPTYSAPSAPKA